jgi:hypothetical protein
MLLHELINSETDCSQLCNVLSLAVGSAVFVKLAYRNVRFLTSDDYSCIL